MSDLVLISQRERIVTLTLNDPDKRNAMSVAMFDALEAKLREAASVDSAHVLHIRANGKAFCAGFDLAAAVAQPALLELFIHRLSGVIRSLRRSLMVVIAEVKGAALAGGCAMLSGCDLVIASPGAKFGYPVHAIGISPAVTIPTLSQMIGPGAARSLLLGGRLISAAEAENIGLVARVSASDESLADETRTLCDTLANHGRNALAATKHWLNELDGSLENARFEGPAASSAQLATMPEAVTKLREFWSRRGS